MNKIITKLGLLFFTGSFLLVLFFHSFLIDFLTTWSIKAYSESKWGYPLDYKGFAWSKGKLFIKSPAIDGETSFKADLLSISFLFDWRKREIRIGIEIDKPLWNLKTPLASHWKNWEKFSPGEKWFKITPSFFISNGQLNWSYEKEDERTLHFDLEGESFEGGKVSLFFDPENLNTQHLSFLSHKSEKGMEVDCSCRGIDCSSFAKLIQMLGIGLSPQWKIDSGLLHGEIKAIFPRSQRPYLQGGLALEKFGFSSQESNLEGYIGSAKLLLEKNAAAYGSENHGSTIIGKVEIERPAFLAYRSDKCGWSIDELEGTIELNSIQTVLMDLKAHVRDAGHDTSWNLQGKANLNSQRAPHLELTLFCSSLSHSDGCLNLSYSQPPGGDRRIEIELKRLTHNEVSILQTLLTSQWDMFNAVKFENGEFDGSMEAKISHKGLEELYMKEFQIKRCHLALKPWNAISDFGQIRGYGKIHLSKENVWQSFDAGIHLEDGSVQFEGMEPHLPLSNIQAHFLIHHGEIKHSLATLEVAGLKGKMDVDWENHKQLLIFKLEGSGNELSELFPLKLQEGFRNHFHQDRVLLVADVKKLMDPIEIEGVLHVQEGGSNRVNLIHFGCELKREKRESGKFLPEGWFYAKQLPLEKFLSPFIFRKGILVLSGEGEFKGSFDHNKLVIKYDADSMKIENENLVIEAVNLHSPNPGQLLGTHEIDLQDFSHHGILPLQNASYLDKKSGLLFDNIQGTVVFNNQSLQVQPMETLCRGIHFAGGLTLDYSDPAPGVFNLQIQTPFLMGKVSQIQDLLSHLDSSSLLYQFPLDGDVSGRGTGLNLTFNFLPKDYQLSGEFYGALTNGFLSLDNELALKEIDMEIEYHHQQKLLSFNEMQGSLLVGKPKCVEEYPFIGKYFHCRESANPDFDFDFSVYAHEDELFRLVGKTQEKEPGIKTLHLNQDLSHLSSIYPHLWRLEFTHWDQIEKFEFGSQFDMGIFLKDLHRFHRTGILCLSDRIISKLSEFLPADGCGTLSLRRQSDHSTFFQFEGLRLKKEDSSEHHCFVKGYKLNKKWAIEQLQWDQWNAYADFEQEGDQWKIPFLGLKIENCLLLGLEGHLNLCDESLNGKLKFCEMDLSQLDQWEKFKPFSSKWFPKGQLKLSGDFEWSHLLTNPREGLKTDLKVESSHLAFGDNPLVVSTPFNMKIDLGNTCLINSLQFSLPSGSSETSLYELKDLEVRLEKDEISFSAFSNLERLPVYIEGQMNWPECRQGFCLLHGKGDSQPLLVDWETSSAQGWVIRSLKGELSRCLFDLSECREAAVKRKFHLKGNVLFDIAHLSYLLPSELGDQIHQLKLSSKYLLKGSFWLGPDLKGSFLQTVSLKGVLSSKEPVIKGYQFQQLQAEVNYIPGRLDIENLTLTDPAGIVKSDNLILTLDPTQNRWDFFSPRLIVKNLKPNLLRDVEPPLISHRSKFRSLLIKRIELNHFCGKCTDRKTWQSQGNLHFLNPTRKNFFHPLFAIPAEIILRLGLDPHVLNPVTGTIYFSLTGERFYLTRFKDMYSQGRGSKFYLADSPQPSWMDLDGNLFMKVRMKQYNLIFKLAELFTVSVQGNIRKPQYSLQKQAKTPHKEKESEFHYKL